MGLVFGKRSFAKSKGVTIYCVFGIGTYLHLYLLPRSGVAHFLFVSRKPELSTLWYLLNLMALVNNVTRYCTPC